MLIRIIPTPPFARRSTMSDGGAGGFHELARVRYTPGDLDYGRDA